MSAIETLVSRSIDLAAKSAAEYCRVRSVRPDIDKLTESLNRHLKLAVPEAIEDARQAAEAGMPGWINSIVAATFRQAGINAAKEALGEHEAEERRQREELIARHRAKPVPVVDDSPIDFRG